ncbi:SDR family NAD(P)-dependent oxidoreductase [Microbacterium sp. CFH 31415]|uniref:SDR family NAD(P)-dependent oxidoreductase n=1 Tax=Microbacterium sp. CFH 31415 TaxID=2921732 RepID=UPI001F136686|nr:SDR family NAD(P)-dependent oxidoreductase [Microbacterium sp. CFH 31415]MCH6230008.1 SDR family NAD(P)-dependent oxidoreductase [Microbacterium sp. CFH 31415]
MTAEGRVVVITGASSGIGRATAGAYARRGARLVIASRSAAALETVAEECRAHGAEVLVVPTDVTEEGEVRALAAAAAGDYGRIDVWVGNAGLFSYGGFEETPARLFREVVAAVARAIVRAPARRRFATSVGLLQRVVVPLHRASPWAYDLLTRFVKKRIELRGDAPLSDGTVFDAPPGASPVTGGWRSRGARLLVWGAGVLLLTGTVRGRGSLRG